jgi:hypothetical protein
MAHQAPWLAYLVSIRYNSTSGSAITMTATVPITTRDRKRLVVHQTPGLAATACVSYGKAFKYKTDKYKYSTGGGQQLYN